MRRWDRWEKSRLESGAWAGRGRAARRSSDWLGRPWGLTRDDEDAHRRLEEGLYYAVRTDAPGRPLMDYHTAQTPKARKGRTFAIPA